MKRNRLSDFKVMITLKSNLVGASFKFTYYVQSDPNNTYVVSWDGEHGTNVVPVNNSNGKQFLVIFERHGLGEGRLIAERQFTITDGDFSDGSCDYNYKELTDIELSDGIFEHVGDIEPVVGINIVKPIRGIDYYTEADKLELFGSVYTKTEADASVAEKIAEAMLNVYTKEEVYTKLETMSAEEINSAIEAALANVHTKDMVYTKSETYSKAEVDAAIAAAIQSYKDSLV